jgi:glycosyltransferase involved in cell wall biosynthesis
VVKQAALQADQFIAPSRYLLNEYAAAGLPADRLLYLDYGFPVESVRRFPRQPSDGPLRVAFVGALAWHKGVHVLAEAFSGLPAGAARLRIWGDPALFPDYAQQVRSLFGHSDAKLMGHIANERVGEVLADSDVLVVPSLWYENSPLVIQEAQAAGVPVVTSGHGALAEKVRHGVDGLHFPPGDADALRQALQRLVDEPDLLPRLRTGIQPPPDIAEHTRQMETIYERLLGQRDAE